MKKLSVTLFALLALAGGAAEASQPLAFDFMVTGSDLLRPVLVFHDGENTYIQPPDNIPLNAITIKAAEAAQYGPYIMVKGIPKAFTMNLKKEQVSITYLGEATARSIVSATAMLAPAAAPSDAPQQAHAPQQTLTLASPVGVARRAPEVGGTAAATPSEACDKRIARTEAAYMVGFDFPAGALPAASLAKLKIAILPTTNIEAVYVSLPPIAESGPAPRSKALGEALRSMGIPEDKIHTDFKGKTDLGAELRIIRATLVACATASMRIEAPHSGSVTMIGTADASQLLKGLAQKLGVMFRTEGEPIPLPVSVAESEVPLITVLQKIGNDLNKRAIIVSRPNELLIRYRTQP